MSDPRRRWSPELLVTAAGVVVALFIGVMQVYIAFQQKQIADQQARVSMMQGDIQAVSGWLAFLKDPDPSVRYTAMLALEHIGTEAAIAPLAAALSDSETLVRRQAARALSRLPADATIDVLVTILSNQDPKTVEAAIDTLEPIGLSSLPRLERALAQRDPHTRANERQAIQRILLNERALKKIGALQAQGRTPGRLEIVVAFLGTGADRSLPDIRRALIEEVSHLPTREEPGVPTTLAARLIAGSRDSDIAGVASGVRLISEQVISAHSGGSLTVVRRPGHRG